MEYYDCEDAAKLADCQRWAAAWKEAAKFHMSYYDNQKRKEVARLKGEGYKCQLQLDEVVDALKAVEHDDHGYCLWCEEKVLDLREPLSQPHAPDCLRQTALALCEPERSE